MNLIEEIEVYREVLKVRTQSEGVLLSLNESNVIRDIFKRCKEELEKRQWIPVAPETMPDINQPVMLININKWENTGHDEHNRNVQDCGYLSYLGTTFWSAQGGRPLTLDSYTHWMAVTVPEA